MNHLRLSRCFKALGDANRLRIVAALSAGEACVCELAWGLKLKQPNLSRHLRVLENAGLVRARRDGNWIIYSLTEDRVFAPALAAVKEAAGRDPALRKAVAAVDRADRCEIGARLRRPTSPGGKG
jgi:ArsR family transcriptional regulator